MIDDLVTKVAKALCAEFDEDWSDEGCRDGWVSAARRVAPIVLEAAANSAERYSGVWEEEDAAARRIADTIRAMSEAVNAAWR